MKKSFFLGSVGLAAAALVAFPSTVMAQVVGDDPALDAQCVTLLKPNANSGFTTLAINVDSQVISIVTQDTGIISTVGIGTPVLSYTGFQNARVNGKSVNIHADATFTSVYPGGALVTYATKITTTTEHSGECHVHKQVNGTGTGDDVLHPGYQVAPPGLQNDARVSYTTMEMTTGTRTATIPGPWTDPNGGGTSQVVICISPGRNPGAWRNQNGYTGSLGTCSRAWYDSLGSTPSVSVPTT